MKLNTPRSKKLFKFTHLGLEGSVPFTFEPAATKLDGPFFNSFSQMFLKNSRLILDTLQEKNTYILAYTLAIVMTYNPLLMVINRIWRENYPSATFPQRFLNFCRWNPCFDVESACFRHSIPIVVTCLFTQARKWISAHWLLYHSRISRVSPVAIGLMIQVRFLGSTSKFI